MFDAMLTAFSNFLFSSLLRTTSTQLSSNTQTVPSGYIADAGIIWMTGQNNPVGDPDHPEAALPYLYEQANVLNTLLKNADSL
jgi:hypothetical protein